jgi:ribulose-5-phosphate 4-epimerase/fuculose-1-phosphate aldolase
VNEIIKLSRAVVELVNPLNKASSTVRDILIPSKIGKEVVQAASQIRTKNLAVGNMGEISIRIAGSLEKFVINSSTSDMGNLTEKDLCLVDILNGNVLGVQQPARHFELHREIYRQTAANTVILCQPPAAMVCGFHKSLPQQALWPEINAVSEQLECVENDMKEVFSKIKTHQFLIIQGIGLLVQGTNLKESFWNAEIIERFCQISILNYEGN